jgi:hypothetical protein
MLAAQYRDLVPEHQQFGVLRGRRTGEQRKPTADADEDQVQQTQRHKPAILPAL